jgi:opacity protein-like surface antigen
MPLICARDKTSLHCPARPSRKQRSASFGLSINPCCASCARTSFTAGQSGSSISPGFLWGLGFEYALVPQWTLKAETNFIYFSASNVNLACTGCVVNATQSSISSYEVLFKVGANYRFN